MNQPKRRWSARGVALLQDVAAAGMLAVAASAMAAAPAAAPRADQLEFRSLYRELIDTNTSHSVGSCTLASERMAAHLRAAGYPDSDLHPFAVAEHPKDGGLVAVLPGTDRGAKAILLLAHLDVVEARREDWTRDPFTLVEEGGYFYGRGTFDDKSMAAVWVDTLIRLRKEGYRPKRAIKMALTCGEEGGATFVGAEYLVNHERQLIDARSERFPRRFRGIGVPGQRPLPVGIELIPQRRQRDRVEPVNPARSRGHVLDQASVLEDLQMLGHRRPAHRQPGRQLPHSLRPVSQARHDGAARAVGQRAPPVSISVSIH